MTHLTLSSILIFVSVACGVYLIAAYWMRYGDQLDDRLKELGDTPVPEAESTRKDTSLWNALGWLFRRLVPNRAAEQDLHQRRLIHAGIYSTSALGVFFAVKLALMILPPLTAILLVYQGFFDPRLGIPIGCTIGAAGMILPSFWLDRRIARRKSTLRRSLPDFLDLVIVCMEGGLSSEATFRRVSDELRLAHPLLANEMTLVVRDMELGVSLDVALRSFADRSDDENIRTLATFIREARRFGTSLTQALRTHADMLRTQREQLAEMKAQKASVKILLPTLLFIFPAVFVVLVGPAIIQIQEAFAK